MTSQSNAYFANKLKERELDEVKVPEVRLKQRSLEEVDKPKVAISALEYQERARANRANEDIKAQELAEQQRYHDQTYYIDSTTKLTRGEQLDKAQMDSLGKIYSKGTLQNGYGSILAGLFNQNADAIRNKSNTSNDGTSSGSGAGSSGTGNGSSGTSYSLLGDIWNRAKSNNKIIEYLDQGIQGLSKLEDGSKTKDAVERIVRNKTKGTPNIMKIAQHGIKFMKGKVGITS